MAIGSRKTLLVVALGALGALAAPALGQEPKEPPPALERLMRLEGHWEGDCQAVIEGKRYTVAYHAEFRRTKDGSGLTLSEWFDSADLGAFRGENLVGYDPFTRKIRWFSVDNLGTTHEHVGDWTSDTRFAMEHRGLREGKRYVEKLAIDVQGDALAVRLVGTLAGKKIEELSGTFHRAPIQSSR